MTATRALVIVLFAAGIAARLGNGWSFPVLDGYDAFSHFSYIWYLAQTWQVPVASQGWSYFHPPLYYAAMAALWDLLDGVDPVVRLRVGKLVIAALGCLHPLLAWKILRERLPGEPLAAVLGSGLLLFIPVSLYSAGFLGNEGLHAVLGSLSLFVLLRVLDRPSAARAALLGACLGLAMLAKFSAITIVAAALAALLLKHLRGGRRHGGAAAIAATVALLLCGPWYLRNVMLYGNPFEMARESSFLSVYVEANQPQASRGPGDYLTFDPLILRRPNWPRGATPDSDQSARDLSRAMRESVWTGLYANAWFDGFGGWVLPPITDSEAARRAGQLLLTLGLLPTGMVLLGAWSALQRLRRQKWDDATVAFGLATAAMLALFVYGTWQAPIAAAVKATYFLPIGLAFAWWIGNGVVFVRRHTPALVAPAATGCAGLAVFSLLVFWQGLLFTPGTWPSRLPGYDASKRNQLGVVYHAGGRDEAASALFERSAAEGSALAVENLAFLALDGGHPRDALRKLRRAARLHTRSSEGGPIGRERFLQMAAAEYDHSVGVVLSALGRRERAQARWRRTLAALPAHAEAAWNLAASQLDAALVIGSAAPRQQALDAARTRFAELRRIDPGLQAAWSASAAVEALAGNCEAAAAFARRAARPSFWTPRSFPAEAGNGAGLAASIGRRRLIDVPVLDPERALAGCRAA